MQSGEHDQSAKGLSLSQGAASRSGEQLGLYGVRVFGLDAEAVERIVGSRQRQFGSASCSRRASIVVVEDRVRDLSEFVDVDSRAGNSFVASVNGSVVNVASGGGQVPDVARSRWSSAASLAGVTP